MTLLVVYTTRATEARSRCRRRERRSHAVTVGGVVHATDRPNGWIGCIRIPGVLKVLFALLRFLEGSATCAQRAVCRTVVGLCTCESEKSTDDEKHNSVYLCLPFV